MVPASNLHDVNSIQMFGPLQEAQKRQTILDEDTVNLLKKFDVIGMTVTGAATRLHLLGMCFKYILNAYEYYTLICIRNTQPMMLKL